MGLQRMVTINYGIMYYIEFAVPCGKSCLLQNSVIFKKEKKKRSLHYNEILR